jgi:site-specific DNA-methyltransferase (adenine-specific)
MNNIKLINDDCMNVMKDYENNYFDLAIVDPPYGINVCKMTLGNGKEKIYRGNNNWDIKPPKKAYFKELFRISKNQIIFGANHFIEQFCKNSSCWLFWDKGTGSNDFADGELAWTSFKKTLRKVKVSWVGANAKEKNDIKRMHPTQKPVKLYEWLLKNYSKKEDKILDTHLGSGSSAIASYYFGVKEFVGIELDKEYFETMNKRFKEQTKQIKLF